jgi:hypothetical protein
LAFVAFGSAAWPADLEGVRYRNADPAVKYVGSKTCASAGCHQKLAREFTRTPMGSAMDVANRPEELARVAKPITIYNANFDRYFKVFLDGKNLFQSEYQLDADKRVVFEASHKLEYVVGSGMNGFTYLVRRDNRLFEAPLSYYSKTGQWELSPGYVAADMGFSRPVLSGCLACHNGQAEAVPNREALYRDPPFRFGEVSIGCEVCHGPGELHLREAGTARRGTPDPSIVNPAKLPPRLSDDVCMNCHQGGHTRILQPGKDYLDFRPGMPLDNVAAIFKVPLEPNQREEANRALVAEPSHDSLETPTWWKNSSMEMSTCYLASGGQLHCVTCHRIHQRPTELTKAAFFRDKCLTCHTDKSCRISSPERMQHEPANDCAGCHMPKRPVGGIAHSFSTNHRIMRRPGQPLPEIAFKERTDPPGLVHVNASSESSALPGLTKLAAYGEVMAKNPALKEQYLAVLDELSRTQPDDPLVLAALGRKAVFEKDYDRAIEYLSKALEKGSEATTTFLDLGDALSGAGRHEEAAQVLERGVAVSPYAQVLYKSLALEYITLKQYPRAHETIKAYVTKFPEDSFMRGLLDKVERNRPAGGSNKR